MPEEDQILQEIEDQERTSKQAINQTREQYPYISEDSDRFYKIALNIYEQSMGKEPK